MMKRMEAHCIFLIDTDDFTVSKIAGHYKDQIKDDLYNAIAENIASQTRGIIHVEVNEIPE